MKWEGKVARDLGLRFGWRLWGAQFLENGMQDSPAFSEGVVLCGSQKQSPLHYGHRANLFKASGAAPAAGSSSSTGCVALERKKLRVRILH